MFSLQPGQLCAVACGWTAVDQVAVALAVLFQRMGQFHALFLQKDSAPEVAPDIHRAAQDTQNGAVRPVRPVSGTAAGTVCRLHQLFHVLPGDAVARIKRLHLRRLVGLNFQNSGGVVRDADVFPGVSIRRRSAQCQLLGGSGVVIVPDSTGDGFLLQLRKHHQQIQQHSADLRPCVEALPDGVERHIPAAERLHHCGEVAEGTGNPIQLIHIDAFHFALFHRLQHFPERRAVGVGSGKAPVSKHTHLRLGRTDAAAVFHLHGNGNGIGALHRLTGINCDHDAITSLYSMRRKKQRGHLPKEMSSFHA